MKKTLFVAALGLCGMVLLGSFGWHKKKKSKLPKHYVYVPSGELFTSIRDMMDDYTVRIDGNEHESVPVEGFYISSIEVTNGMYAEFLTALKTAGGGAALEEAHIRHEIWQTGSMYNEPLAKMYHTHSAYAGYPVVNVTHRGAELYCEWMTKQWNAEFGEKYGMEVEFKLPTKEQWMYAARGGDALAPLPWGGYYLRNTKGQVLANYKSLSDLCVKYDSDMSNYVVDRDCQVRMGNGGYTTSPSRSHLPNNYGIYNMSGNVSERLSTPGATKGGSWGSTGYYLHIDAEDEFEGKAGASPYVGFRPIAILKEK